MKQPLFIFAAAALFGLVGVYTTTPANAADLTLVIKKPICERIYDPVLKRYRLVGECPKLSNGSGVPTIVHRPPPDEKDCKPGKKNRKHFHKKGKKGKHVGKKGKKRGGDSFIKSTKKRGGDSFTKSTKKRGGAPD